MNTCVIRLISMYTCTEVVCTSIRTYVCIRIIMYLGVCTYYVCRLCVCTYKINVCVF